MWPWKADCRQGWFVRLAEHTLDCLRVSCGGLKELAVFVSLAEIDDVMMRLPLWEIGELIDRYGASPDRLVGLYWRSLRQRQVLKRVY